MNNPPETPKVNSWVFNLPATSEIAMAKFLGSLYLFLKLLQRRRKSLGEDLIKKDQETNMVELFKLPLCH